MKILWYSTSFLFNWNADELAHNVCVWLINASLDKLFLRPSFISSDWYLGSWINSNSSFNFIIWLFISCCELFINVENRNEKHILEILLKYFWLSDFWFRYKNFTYDEAFFIWLHDAQDVDSILLVSNW